MSLVEATVERKPRTIETIIEKNGAIESRLTEALTLLHSIEERLVGRSEQPEVTCDSPTPTYHITILKQQQDRLEALCIDLLNSINILEENI